MSRVKRETYVGPWLPEPLLADTASGPAQHAELADSLSQAFLVVLERLTPVERAAFLLRELFGYDYAKIDTRLVKVNGQPGRVLPGSGTAIWHVLSIDVVDGQILTVRIVRNPEKLAHSRSET